MAGEGSFRRGGRWNPPGVRVIYCAESRSLAALEVLVNVREAPVLFAQQWVVIPVTLPVRSIEIPRRVPDNWRTTPFGTETPSFGGEWVHAARSLALRIPSAVVLGEFNYLLNPAHPEFAQAKVGAPEPFSFDVRLQR